MILGVDEVGRGPWAGPLVVGAVVLGGADIGGLTDSKKLTKKRREEFDAMIRKQADGYGLGWVSANEIDEIGLSDALRLATKRAVEQINVPYHEIIIDGTINFLQDTTKGQYVTTMKKADLLVPCVSAASIIAKVARDNYMAEQDDIYPGYKFKNHVGYGTAVHRAAIETLGVTPLHRLSFAPLQQYRPLPSSPIAKKRWGRRSLVTGAAPLAVTRAGVNKNPSSNNQIPTSKAIGDAGEDEAANHLVRAGHEIIDRNWKTKYCEIDIISHHNSTIYFTEVKYRKNDDQGGGFAAVTAKKQRQMKFAAEYYVLKNNLQNYDLRLAAIDVSGQPPHVREFLKLG